MDMKKLFQVLVVGGAVIGTGTACNKAKTAQTDTNTQAAQPTADEGSTAEKAAPEAKEGGGASGW